MASHTDFVAALYQERDSWKAHAEKAETDLAQLTTRLQGLPTAWVDAVQERDEWKIRTEKAEAELAEERKKSKTLVDTIVTMLGQPENELLVWRTQMLAALAEYKGEQ